MNGRFSIPVVTRTQDNGDGGFTTYAYNTREELLADHPAFVDGFDGTPEERATREKKIMSEDDPHEDGYIGTGTVEIVIEGGHHVAARLASPISFHGGQ